MSIRADARLAIRPDDSVASSPAWLMTVNDTKEALKYSSSILGRRHRIGYVLRTGLSQTSSMGKTKLSDASGTVAGEILEHRRCGKPDSFLADAVL